MKRALVCTLIALALTTARAAAQEPRLVGRVSEETRTQLDGMLNTARINGLPTEPLVDRALEGVAKGARPELIVTAVNRLLDELKQARLLAAAAATDHSSGRVGRSGGRGRGR
jgi:hypothetical protein